MPAVEPDAVTDVEPLHGLGEIAFSGLAEQVVMIGHEHVGVQADAEALDPLGEQFQKVFAVTLIAEGGALFVAAGSEVIPKAGAIYAQKSGHGREGRCLGRQVKANVECSKLTPIASQSPHTDPALIICDPGIYNLDFSLPPMKRFFFSQSNDSFCGVWNDLVVSL